MANVLIVDDDADSCEAMARFLAKCGHSARCVTDGREALAALGTQVSDFLVIDVRMPVMDGIALVEVIRSYLRWSTIPVAVVTAYPEEPRLHRLANIGVNTVFRKSDFVFEDLLAWMNQASSAMSAPDGPQPPGLRR